MKPELGLLHPYPFQKLAELCKGVHEGVNLDPKKTDPTQTISLSIGEPKHAPPEFVLQALRDNAHLINRYPSTRGDNALREAICNWLVRRFQLANTNLNSEEHILPVNGTREGLFSFAQCVIDSKQKPLVFMPNPFYQIYEGATLLAGAEPRFLDCTEASGFVPKLNNISSEDWQRCQLFYICTPGNPSGAVMSQAYLQKLIHLSDEHDFLIVSDECYSEIYLNDQAPTGLLQACADMGRHDFERCIVMHSLSKRSNVPGLRSGFVAGDKSIISQYLRYRTYHGCTMPVPTQLASIAAWNDEQHVIDNRMLYKRKFASTSHILSEVWPLHTPPAGFYYWAETPIDDQVFTRELYAQENVLVLPGSFLAREVKGNNPGKNRVRMALVATAEECNEASQRIVRFMQAL